MCHLSKYASQYDARAPMKPRIFNYIFVKYLTNSLMREGFYKTL